jgi:hypothetical protein
VNEHVDVPGDVGLELLLAEDELGEVLSDVVCTVVLPSEECYLGNALQNDASNLFKKWVIGWVGRAVRESDLPQDVLA